HLDLLAKHLREPLGQRTPVILLSGETGIGRRYLLTAALYAARSNGLALLDSQLDLSAFNTNAANAFQSFIDRELSQLSGAAHKRATEIVEFLSSRILPQLTTTNLISAGIVEIALRLSLSLTDLAKLYTDRSQGIPVPKGSTRESFH